MRKTQRREVLPIARRRQRDVLCDVMLSARQCETWLTLDEADALPAGKHFRAVAAFAQAGVRRIRGGEKAARWASSCAEKTSERSGSISSSAQYAGSSWVRACGPPDGHFRGNGWLAET